jgi:hypothetical protein
MEVGHRLDVTGDVPGQPASEKLTLSPFRHRHIDIGDRPPESLGVLRRHVVLVLRRASRRLDAGVGQRAYYDGMGDAVLLELEVEIGVRETALGAVPSILRCLLIQSRD